MRTYPLSIKKLGETEIIFSLLSPKASFPGPDSRSTQRCKTVDKMFWLRSIQYLHRGVVVTIGDLTCSLLLMVSSENKKLRSVQINQTTQVPAVDLAANSQATSMLLCSSRATDFSEGCLYNISQKHNNFANFSKCLGHQYSTNRKCCWKKIHSLKVAEGFPLFKKRTALNNFDKNF